MDLYSGGMDREKIRRTLLEMLHCAAPAIRLAAFVVVASAAGLGLASAGLGVLGLAVMVGVLVMAFRGLLAAVHQFLSGCGVIKPTVLFLLAGRAARPLCRFTSFRTRALRVAAPPPRFTPAI